MKNMNVTKEQLLQSGFNHADLQIIQNNIDSYGGTLEETIQDLANRFRVVIWVFYGCIIIFTWIALTHENPYIIATGISLLIAMAIVLFMQPPVLSYKSWRYWKANRG